MLTFSNLMPGLIRDVKQKIINPGAMLWLAGAFLIFIKISLKHLIPIYLIQTSVLIFQKNEPQTDLGIWENLL